MSDKSIAFIVPYFGKLPNYFQFWLDSCRFNESVHWFIFTDDQSSYDVPDNVTFFYLSFEEIKKRFEERLGFAIALPNAYKLTDFKPSYGYVFQEYLKEFDFWGFCDVDLIFGNIRKFITDDILENYDKVLANGHFQLIRNKKKYNELFMKRINGRLFYKEAYTDGAHKGFDEYGDIAFHSICLDDGLRIYINNLLFADINSWFNHFSLTFVERLLLPNEKGFVHEIKRNKNDSSIFSFDKGTLHRFYINMDGELDSTEYMYVHFQKRPMSVSAQLCEGQYNSFLMVPNEFLPLPSEVGVVEVKKWGGKRFFSRRRIRRQIYITLRMWLKNNFNL